ncbi:FecR family protein [Chitinophaga skermanii]|uniref:FecR family protein n=1 Tax=Chitinophaga skermanii TaxID=331697 RepID=A0A327R5W6_9BACT|nr:FecR family protein [Chitinophaga skermanii]RAJ11084.1 FecR family protein [Chitinophaga skermanii]
MDQAYLQILLEKHSKNTCTPEEQQLLFDWLQTIEAKNAGAMEDFLPGEWAKIKAGTWQKVKPTSKVRSMYKRWMVAAATIGVAAVSTVLYLNKHHSKRLVVTNTQPAVQIVYLPDSSMVVVAPGAEIAYNEGFEGNERKVEVNKGTALFDVKPNFSKPFIVQNDDVQTQVLGTAFKVEYNKTFKLHRVSVSSGKVRVVDANNKGYILHPSEYITIDKEKVLIGKVDVKDVDAFRNNELVLRDANLQTLVHTLQLHYHVAVKTSSDLRAGNITFRVPATMGLPALLEVIEKISYQPKLHFQLKGEELFIY